MTNKIEFRITKDETHADVRLSEMSLQATKALIVLFQSLTNIVESSTNSEGVKFSVSEGSAIVAADCTEEQVVDIERKFEEIIISEANSNRDSGWKQVQKLISSNGLEYVVRFVKNDVETVITPRFVNARIIEPVIDEGIVPPTLPEPSFAIIFIDGKLNQNGGTNPNFHIIPSPGAKAVTISCTDRQAAFISNKLYQTIYVSAWISPAKTRKLQYCDSYPDSVLFNELRFFFETLTNVNQAEGLAHLHEKLYRYIDNKEYATLRRFLRLFCYENADVNILKTILVVTKGIKDNEEFNIKESRSKIKLIVDKRLETNKH